MTPSSGQAETRGPRQSSPLAADVLSVPLHVRDLGISKLEPEPQDGPTEYKLHLLLRSRRSFTKSTTAHLLPGSQHSKPRMPLGASSHQSLPSAAFRPSANTSIQTRQHRLQHLTTQLLWRLQQSSPFHSSSTRNLVLPRLPEATPTLGLPSKPAQLLPGLEESQGALYEIGVSDEGIFVGLAEDELEESLVNLRAMAASLGCIVEILRKVIVGKCEWTEEAEHADTDAEFRTTRTGNLWVAEAIVRPDLTSKDTPSPSAQNTPRRNLGFNSRGFGRSEEELQSTVEQLRISLTGVSGSGKSSLLGTLTTGTLDNGRGKTRLGLLRHRHEIVSGVTSSVAQELIGYTKPSETSDSDRSHVINYAAGDVSSWNDIHSLTTTHGRLVFVSDSPGTLRFSKSTFRTLMSWDPHWTILCVPADDGDESFCTLSVMFLNLCLKLGLQVLIVITKMDIATKLGLRQTLARLLSTLKEVGKKPVMLSSNPSTDSEDSSLNLQHIKPDDIADVTSILSAPDFTTTNAVPILFASVTTGTGISKIHALLQQIPIPSPPTELNSPIQQSPLFYIDEVFSMPISKVYSGEAPTSSTSPSLTNSLQTGIVVCGHLAHGTVFIGETLLVGPFRADNETAAASSSQTPRTSSFYHPITILSLRNLRLPVRSLLSGQVGTIGIALENPPSPSPDSDTEAASALLAKVRKGMVLTKQPLPTSTSFSALFDMTAFEKENSPPLILGGHALAYWRSARAAVKVSAVEKVDMESEELEGKAEGEEASGDQEEGVFSFDDTREASYAPPMNDQTTLEMSARQETDQRQVKISFDFLSSVEWCPVGERVLIMPSASSTTQSTSAIPGDGSPRPRSVSGGGSGSVAGAAEDSMAKGLVGFVGKICE
ncbi:MAG: hypothetical protein Q9227_008000 [Pyrenula ochraceoflavens]